MQEDALRLLIRDAIARHLETRHGSGPFRTALPLEAAFP